MDPKLAQRTIPQNPQVQSLLTSQPQPTNPEQLVCKKCSSTIIESYNFCPNCGKKIKEPPYKFSLVTTIIVIAESLLLPPLGIFPGIKYLRMKEIGAKILGTAAIIITILMTILMIIFLKNYVDSVSKQLNDVNYLNNIYNSPSSSVQDQVKELQNQIK